MKRAFIAVFIITLGILPVFAQTEDEVIIKPASVVSPEGPAPLVKSDLKGENSRKNENPLWLKDSRGKPLIEKEGREPSLSNFYLWFAVVLLLMIGCVLIFKKFLSRSRFLASTGAIAILSRKQLTSKHALYLVEVGRKIFLIGVTKDGFQALGEIDHPEEVATVRAKSPVHREDSIETSFKTRLDENLAEYEKEKIPSQGGFSDVMGEIEEIKKTVKSWRV